MNKTDNRLDTPNVTFYLKVNRDIDYTYVCLQWWIDVAKSMQSSYYIICDKEKLRLKITEKCKLYDDKELVFIESDTQRAGDLSSAVTKASWKKASDAHLTSFFHAQENGFNRFWNIDADDTMFLLAPQRAAQALQIVEQRMEKENIKLCSLDMWWTIHKGECWSFGVTYTNMENWDWIEILWKNAKNYDYKLEKYDDGNLDVYLSYLRNRYRLPIESFYIKNTDFIHWGAPYGPLHYKYKDEFVYFPKKLTYLLSNTLRYGRCRINHEVIGIDAGISAEDKKTYQNRAYLKTVSKSYGVSPFFYKLRSYGWKEFLKMVRTYTVKKIRG